MNSAYFNVRHNRNLMCNKRGRSGYFYVKSDLNLLKVNPPLCRNLIEKGGINYEITDYDNKRKIIQK